jgi:hypothetical protein
VDGECVGGGAGLLLDLGISVSGNLLIELEDDIIKEFGIKEVSLA